MAKGGGHSLWRLLMEGETGTWVTRGLVSQCIRTGPRRYEAYNATVQGKSKVFGEKTTAGTESYEG